MTKFIRYLTLLTLALACAGSAAAQGNNRIDGQVLDPQGNPLPDATVTLKSEESGQVLTLKTDKDGKFVQLGLRAGIYDVSVTSTNQQIPPYTQKLQIKEGESGTLLINFKELMAKYANSEEAKKRDDERREDE